MPGTNTFQTGLLEGASLEVNPRKPAPFFPGAAMFRKRAQQSDNKSQRTRTRISEETKRELETQKTDTGSGRDGRDSWDGRNTALTSEGGVMESQNSPNKAIKRALGVGQNYQPIFWDGQY